MQCAAAEAGAEAPGPHAPIRHSSHLCRVSLHSLYTLYTAERAYDRLLMNYDRLLCVYDRLLRVYDRLIFFCACMTDLCLNMRVYDRLNSVIRAQFATMRAYDRHTRAHDRNLRVYDCISATRARMTEFRARMTWDPL